MYRYHPAVSAQTFTSLPQLYPGRVFLGAGSGEVLNEQAATGQWDEWETRSDRPVEAIDLIRQPWIGEEIAFKGKFFQTTARLYDTPPQPMTLYVASNGPKSMAHAGQAGDGLITDMAGERRSGGPRQGAARPLRSRGDSDHRPRRTVFSLMPKTPRSGVLTIRQRGATVRTSTKQPPGDGTADPQGDTERSKRAAARGRRTFGSGVPRVR